MPFCRHTLFYSKFKEIGNCVGIIHDFSQNRTNFFFELAHIDSNIPKKMYVLSDFVANICYETGQGFTF
jgi:hypothetical protein